MTEALEEDWRDVACVQGDQIGRIFDHWGDLCTLDSLGNYIIW
jgi:hypothetical protein